MQERRNAPRDRTFLGGSIAFNDLTVDCLIPNRSRDGAKLIVNGTLFLPREFDLTFKREKRTRRVRLTWRRRDEAGVAFTAPAREPRIIAVDANGYIVPPAAID
ncbi:conserved hypothetical protein [Methylobacterium sp. 4-46]|uniref:PilZ domain-containing protein n=1 Tax=unclassified Methylobacterium TaxID=2615210 RepID=UPI000152E60A|nr:MULTISPECIES: PilZ domain-containing protein [Methylobacterium]ACA19873.1 conserved hypothetical protein [Methylobacterium sp. 4-46]WFT79056.1 hypothetical protein QA634_28060 [Methylobacterium nodulans]